MKPEALAVILGAVVAIAQGLNVYLFQRIRVAQLEGEQRILDKVEEKYVRKDSALLVTPRNATA